MFQSCRKFTSLDLSDFDTSKVEDMYSMFQFCYKLDIKGLEKFRNKNIRDMSYMLQNCEKMKTFNFWTYFSIEEVTDI